MTTTNNRSTVGAGCYKILTSALFGWGLLWPLPASAASLTPVSLELQDKLPALRGEAIRQDKLPAAQSEAIRQNKLQAVQNDAIGTASLIPVSLELQLLIDVSGSVDSQEYNLQLEGYRRAFTNLAPRFGTGGFGSVAVNTVFWSWGNQQQVVIPWFLINDANSAIQFASTIASVYRPFVGATAPGSAIDFAAPLFASNQFKGQRWVIDVSGDGEENDGISTLQARDRALAMGVTSINGLPILNDDPNLLNWYQSNLIGGQNSFAIAARDFTEFGTAIEQKLAREIQPTEPVPEPTTIFGTFAFGAVVSWWRRKRNSIGH